MTLLPDRPGIPPMAKLPEPETLDIESILAAFETGLRGRSCLSGKNSGGGEGSGDGIDLICVLGPTASGKTRFAVGLARKANELRGISATHAEGGPRGGAEIISGDSRQVYRGMDIGTGKDLCEYGDIPHHLIDIAPAGSRYTIYDYQRDFAKAYQDIIQRGGLPILCGGSGLYIEAATCGYTLPCIPADPRFRAEMEAHDTDTLRRMLLSARPHTGEGTLQSRRRIIRALEVARHEDAAKDGGTAAGGPTKPSNGTAAFGGTARDDGTARDGCTARDDGTAASTDRDMTRDGCTAASTDSGTPMGLPRRTYYIGTLVTREERVARIDRRLDERLQGGLIEEVRGLLDSGIAPENLVYYGLEYKFVTQHVLGVLSYGQMRTLLANAIHQFAKRQMTWLRGMEKDGIKIHWVRPDSH